MTLRLASFDNHAERADAHTPRKRRRRRGPASERSNDRHATPEARDSDGRDDADAAADAHADADAAARTEAEARATRDTNTYPGGARNTIGSRHQRRWFVSLDRAGCGLQRRWRGRRRINGGDGDDDVRDPAYTPFVVRGANHETSVVTGRRAADVLADEGVTNYIGRRGWRPVLE